MLPGLFQTLRGGVERRKGGTREDPGGRLFGSQVRASRGGLGELGPLTALLKYLKVFSHWGLTPWPVETPAPHPVHSPPCPSMSRSETLERRRQCLHPVFGSAEREDRWKEGAEGIWGSGPSEQDACVPFIFVEGRSCFWPEGFVGSGRSGYFAFVVQEGVMKEGRVRYLWGRMRLHKLRKTTRPEVRRNWGD